MPSATHPRRQVAARPAPSTDTHGPDWPDVAWAEHCTGRLRHARDGRFWFLYSFSKAAFRRTPEHLRPPAGEVFENADGGLSTLVASRLIRPTDSYLVEAPDGDGSWLVIEPGRPTRPLFRDPDVLRRDMKVWDRACGEYADRRRKGVVR